MEANITLPESDHTDSYDVVIMGGALSGAATATLLLRQNPGIRILILEKSMKLSRRVGEATVEVSAYFMGRVLGLTQYLNESHLAKQGLRFWFTNGEVKTLAEASELGPLYQVRVPSYQLDRAAFDEEVLRRAGAAGAEILRPATIIDVRLQPGKEQTVTFRNGDGTRTVRAQGRLVEKQYRTSDCSGLVEMERRQGLGQPRASREISLVVARSLCDT